MHGLLLSKVAARASLAASSAVPGGLLALRGGLLALRGGRSLGPLTPELMVDIAIVLNFAVAAAILAPRSPAPAHFLGKKTADDGASVLGIAGFAAAMLAALHAFLRFHEMPATEHLNFFIFQFGAIALIHLYKLFTGVIISCDALVVLTPMALLSAYLARD
ncbi:hypothetical protein T492DRAFT_955745 [Pavlovales sp. CCMP2436]|nr:hypothetical protein T492DRAFT_955745 [Pavlovales sp. CCMP2436]